MSVNIGTVSMSEQEVMLSTENMNTLISFDEVSTLKILNLKNLYTFYMYINRIYVVYST